MSGLKWIAERSLAALMLLVVWAFLWMLPVRSFCLSEVFPILFSVPFSRDDLWIFYGVAFGPMVLFGPPLYLLHQWHEENEAANRP